MIHIHLSPLRSLTAEALGTGLLVLAVVGSGIMAENLSGGNAAVALLANTIATGAALYVLIAAFVGISGAHFNPVVSVLEAGSGAQPWRRMLFHMGAQVTGGIAGALIANAMFGLPALEFATMVRTGPGQWTGEIIATFGLILTIRLVGRHHPAQVPAAIALYIVSAYWFTASTSFANPAVTIARTLSDSFAGIRPLDAPAFIAAQTAGGFLGHVAGNWFTSAPQK